MAPCKPSGRGSSHLPSLSHIQKKGRRSFCLVAARRRRPDHYTQRPSWEPEGGSDKRRHMNRREIPLFGGVSRRESFPFNLGAINQSQDRLGHMLGRAMRCQSFSIAHRIIDHNPALSRDCVGGIGDHHGVARRNTQFWGSRVPGIGIRQPCPTLPKHCNHCPSLPNNRATVAQYLGNGCPIIGQRLPNTWATVAQWLGKVGQGCPMLGQWLPIAWARLGNGCPIIGQRLPNIWATVAQWLGKVGQRVPRALGGWVFTNAIRRNFGSSNAPGFW